MIEERVRKVIDELINKLKKGNASWANERDIHYDFFKLLFNTFEPEEIKEKFRWEYPVIPYTGGRNPAKIDLVMLVDKGKFVAIEIEYVSPGESMRSELLKCIEKLYTVSNPNKKNYMEKGFLVPILKDGVRNGKATARGYGMSYSQLCDLDLRVAKDKINELGSPNIELKSGIVLY